MTPPPAERRSDPPVRLAVALADGATGPMLVAKGTGATAEAILDLAFAHDVKVREDAALAQLIATADIDCPVPTQALDAVSAVLAHVYAATRRPHPDDADQR